MGADGTHSGLGLIKILPIFPLAVEGSGGGGRGELFETMPRPPPPNTQQKLARGRAGEMMGGGGPGNTLVLTLL